MDSLQQSAHPLMLSEYSLEELSEMDLYKVPRFSVGFGLKSAGSLTEIVAVHNNQFDVPNLGPAILLAAIRNGGNALDHFGSEKLNQLYDSLGFVVVRSEPYNPEYDPHGMFAAKYGQLPVIYRVLKSKLEEL